MRLRDFILDKKMYFIAHTGSLCLLMLLLSTIGINRSGQIFVLIFMVLGHFLYLAYDYFRRFMFYKQISEHLTGLDKKYLISEFIETPNFYEGELLERIVSESSKAMNDEIAKYRQEWKEYREYIETWVHEIKTPISASYLFLENNHTEDTNVLHNEIRKVEGYVEQALYYARSNHVEKDYIIKAFDLEELIKSTVRKYSKFLISKKCELKFDISDITVYTDKKWLEFILSQIIMNSIKYCTKPMKLSFEVKQENHAVVLGIHDNGPGISQADLKHVFKKGYVGITGRRESKSTGIGLYLCDKLCTKMGLNIQIQSDEGTSVYIAFPNSELISR